MYIEINDKIHLITNVNQGPRTTNINILYKSGPKFNTIKIGALTFLIGARLFCIMTIIIEVSTILIFKKKLKEIVIFEK